MDYRERMEAKAGILFQIADEYLSGRIPLEEAKELLGGEMVSIRPAQLEVMKEELGKRLKEAGSQAEREKLFELFRIYLPRPYYKLQAGHPIRNYFEENCAVRSLLLKLDEMEGEEAAAEDWKDLYDSLSQFTTRIKRQEKNLYALLIPLGMGLQVEKAREIGTELSGLISENRKLLESGVLVEFLYHQRSLSRLFMSYLDLEEKVLYAKALTGLGDQDFVQLRNSDDETGYVLAEPSEEFTPSDNRMHTSGAHNDDGQTDAARIERAKGGEPDPGLILSALLEAKELGIEYYTLSGELVSVMGKQIPEPCRVMESIVRDRQGIKQGILKIKDKITETEPKEIDPRQSIDELFQKYPKFREDFFILDKELEGLKGPFGRDLLKDSTIEMVAKSLCIDAGSLTARINELLKSYSCMD